MCCFYLHCTFRLFNFFDVHLGTSRTAVRPENFFPMHYSWNSRTFRWSGMVFNGFCLVILVLSALTSSMCILVILVLVSSPRTFSVCIEFTYFLLVWDGLQWVLHGNSCTFSSSICILVSGVRPENFFAVHFSWNSFCYTHTHTGSLRSGVSGQFSFCEYAVTIEN